MIIEGSGGCDTILAFSRWKTLTALRGFSSIEDSEGCGAYLGHPRKIINAIEKRDMKRDRKESPLLEDYRTTKY